MTSPLDELYLPWLYSQVADSNETRPSRTYWKLLRQLYTKEFVWIIPNDDNRVEDGRYLRVEFIDSLGLYDVDPDWLALGCSMLELIIGLSRRLSFSGDGEPHVWFWHLIANLGIRYHDRNRFSDDEVEEVLDNVIFRTYEFSGQGGFFPLKHATRDQTKVELWYQLNDYLLER